MLLTNLLDVLNSDTKVILYVEGKRVGMCCVYDFPSRHNLNEYYGNEIEEVKPIGDLKVAVYLK